MSILSLVMALLRHQENENPFWKMNDSDQRHSHEMVLGYKILHEMVVGILR